MRNCNIYDPPSSRYSQLALTPKKILTESIPFSELIEYQNNPALHFDAAFLSAGTRNVHLQVNRIVNQNLQTTYPMLVERVQAGPILAPEFADFLINTGTPQLYVENIIELFDGGDSVIDDITDDYLNLLDTYYTDNFASQTTGGFCSLFTGLLDEIFKIFAVVQGILELIDQLKNLEQLLHDLVDQIKERLMGIIDQVRNQLANCQQSLTLAASRVAQRAADFFEDFRIEQIKERITEMLEDTASRFEDLELNLESIEYIIYRLCNLASAIEDFMSSGLQDLQNLMQNCMNTTQTLTSVSDSARLGAVSAGAFRLSPGSINDIRSRTAGRVNSGAGNSGTWNGRTPPPERYVTVPFTEAERQMAQQLLSASLEDVRAGNYDAYQYLDVRSQASHPGAGMRNGEGYKRLHPEIIMIACRIGRRLGRRLGVNSAYRSPEFNASLRGAARNSFHISGFALDITQAGNPQPDGWNEFIVVASQEGIGGIGVYPESRNNFIHIDIARRRYWGNDRSGGAAYTQTLANHYADLYRNGTPRDDDNTTPPAQQETDTDTTPATQEWTDADAANVEALRESLDGGPAQAQLTDGERAYARSQGYL